MFKRSFGSRDHGARVDKSARLKKSHGREAAKLSKLQRSINGATAAANSANNPGILPPSSSAAASSSRVNDSNPVPGGPLALAPSPIVTLTVGHDGRIFAAHEDVLCQAPFFEAVCHGGAAGVSPGSGANKRIHLPDEEPEVFSAVLEYLYKSDYYPRLVPGRRRDSWHLEDDADRPSRPSIGSSAPSSSMPATPNLGGGSHQQHHLHHHHHNHPSPNPSGSSSATARPEATVRLSGTLEHVLRDTAIYCAADRYGIDELKRLSLRKQGLQSGIDVATILRSARYAYAHTPDSDSRLRAHYLALIIRCRRTFKRSGTMQAEMERGDSKLFFDLFVAMCNHLDDVIEASNSRSPKMV